MKLKAACTWANFLNHDLLLSVPFLLVQRIWITLTDKSFAKNANTSQQQNLKQILEKQIKINKNFLTIKQRNCWQAN